jgi:hypothetical protein
VSILEQVKQRLDEVFYELQEKTEYLRREPDDPDEYAEVDFAATRLDGRLEELMWIRELLQK